MFDISVCYGDLMVFIWINCSRYMSTFRKTVNQLFQPSFSGRETLNADSWPTKKHDQFLKAKYNSNYLFSLFYLSGLSSVEIPGCM